jgi:glycosyltransferase involved in cell wall biosynthesis
MPLVSVIVPAYNARRHIRAALASALAQTVSDLEVLVVDDGSRDDTAAIVAMVAARDTRVRLFRQPNAGVAAARNVALRESAGEFLALLDSDDLWDARFLEEQVGILRARPDVQIVTGNAIEMGGARDGRPARPYPDGRPDPDLAAILTDEEAVFIMTVFRRVVYERLGGFDEALRTNEDYDYWLRAAAAGFVFARNDRPLGRYRRGGATLSANDVRMLRGILRVFKKLRPSLLERPSDLAVIDRQVERFETELLAAEARAAIESGDHAMAAQRLKALRERRPGAALTIAETLARWAPVLLPMFYRARRALLLKRNAAGVPA